MTYYKIKDGYLVGITNSIDENSISLPEGYVNEKILYDNAYSVDANGMVSLSDKYLSKRNLDNTDWKMVRHRDQKDLNIETTLTDEKYQELLTKRQSWREKASE